MSRLRPLIGFVSPPERQAAVIQLAGAGFSVLTLILLARGFGATVTGHYAILSHTVLFGSTVALFGYDVAAARAISAGLAVERGDQARAAIRHYWPRIALGAALVGLALLAGSGLLSLLGLPSLPWWILPLTVIAYTLLRFGSALLRGGLWLRLSQAALAFQRLAFICFLVATVLGGGISAFDPIALAYLASILVSLAITGLLVWRLAKRWSGGAASFESRAPDGYSFGLSSLLISATGWAEVAALGYWYDPAAMGIFRVCVQIVLPVTLVYLAYTLSVGPAYAQLLARGENRAAWQRHRADRRLLLLFGIPVTAGLVVFAEPILGLLGEEFVAGRWPLIILALTGLFNMATATAGTMLNMGHREDVFRRLTILAVIASALCIAILIPLYGILGAAISLAMGVVIREGGAYIAARRIIPRVDEQKTEERRVT